MRVPNFEAFSQGDRDQSNPPVGRRTEEWSGPYSLCCSAIICTACTCLAANSSTRNSACHFNTARTCARILSRFFDASWGLAFA